MSSKAETGKPTIVNTLLLALAAALLLAGVGSYYYFQDLAITPVRVVGLIAVAVAASLGFHVWMPLQNSIAMSLVDRSQSGRVMGTISSVRAFASIVGMGVIARVCARTRRGACLSDGQRERSSRRS